MKFPQALTYRLARQTALSPARLLSPRAIVSFTFDDFPKSAATNGAKMLEDRGVRGSFYATGSFEGRTVNGIEQFDRDDLGRLVEAGHEIGCHTARHLRLTSLSDNEIEAELEHNADLLRSAGHDLAMATLAYPFGDVSPRVKRVVGRRFAAGRGVWSGLNEATFDRMLMKCVCLEPHILAKRPAEAWIDLAVERKAWLIFLTHDVQDNPSSFGIAPAALGAIMDHAQESGAEILPVSHALHRSSVSLGKGPV